MPALQIVALDTATPQLRAPAAADTYTAPRAMDITPVALTGTAATSSLSIAQTWNTTGTPSALDVNVTDTASNASSNLMNLRVGGTSRFSVSKGGRVDVVDIFGSGQVGVNNSRLLTTGVTTIGYFGIGPSNPLVPDLILTRDAANTLAQRNGVNAQAFNIYNTYTDASNYERGFVRWASNRFEIGADALGSGARRNTTIFNRDKAGSYGPRIDLTLEPDGGTNSSALSFTYGGGVYFQWGMNGTFIGNFNSGGFSVGTGVIEFSAGPAMGRDVGFSRSASGVVAVVDNTAGGGGSLEFREQTTPAAPAANGVRIFAQDNGAGKTRLMALFATGAAQQIAIEP